MNYRRIKSWTDGVFSAVMQRCAALDEFRVRLYINGVLYAPADYFTSDSHDAWLTAKAMVRQAKANSPVPV
jgi:hypothetical protein